MCPTIWTRGLWYLGSTIPTARIRETPRRWPQRRSSNLAEAVRVSSANARFSRRGPDATAGPGRGGAPLPRLGGDSHQQGDARPYAETSEASGEAGGIRRRGRYGTGNGG